MAKLGKNVKIHPSAIIFDDVEIGDGCIIGANAVLGGPPEHRDYWSGAHKGVRIGNDCFIGVGVTIDSGTTEHTIVGSNCMILRHSHLGHDSLLEDDINISASVTLAGHVTLMRGTAIGLGGLVIQRALIGSFSMLGMGGVLTKRIPPGEVWTGNPAGFMKPNLFALRKFDVSAEQMLFEKKGYHEYQDKISEEKK